MYPMTIYPGRSVVTLIWIETPRTTDDDGDAVDLEANDDELFLTTTKQQNDNEENGEQQKGECGIKIMKNNTSITNDSAVTFPSVKSRKIPRKHFSEIFLGKWRNIRNMNLSSVSLLETSNDLATHQRWGEPDGGSVLQRDDRRYHHGRHPGHRQRHALDGAATHERLPGKSSDEDQGSAKSF